MEKVVCLACGEIFSQSGNTIIVHAFGTQNPAPAAEEETTPLELMAEVPTQAEVVEGELQKEDVVTQEPSSLEIIAEVPM